MTDTQNPTVAALRAEFASKDVWSNLSESQQNIIKETAAKLEVMTEILQQQEAALEGTPLAEAHSSANVFMVDPVTKANVQFTFRGHIDADVENRITKFLERTTGQTPSLYWLTQDQYRDENWNNKGNAQPTPKQPQPNAQPTQPATGDGQVMTCPALKLVAMQKSDKDNALMWKVWTPKSKYAVPIYMEDEGLEGTRNRLSSIGIDVNNFMKDGKLAEYDLTGWTAHYLPTEKDGEVKPWPSKIVDLTV